MIDAQSNNTFWSNMLKLINDKKVASDKYFIGDNGPLQKVVREDDKPFHALVVAIILVNMYCIKCMMH